MSEQYRVLEATRGGLVAVSDPMYGGVFCLVDPADTFFGEANARARAQDIADMMNWWRDRAVAESDLPKKDQQ